MVLIRIPQKCAAVMVDLRCNNTSRCIGLSVIACEYKRDRIPDPGHNISHSNRYVCPAAGWPRLKVTVRWPLTKQDERIRVAAKGSVLKAIRGCLSPYDQIGGIGESRVWPEFRNASAACSDRVTGARWDKVVGRLGCWFHNERRMIAP